MSTYEQKDNSGAIFKNPNRKTDRHPDLTGSLRVNGQDYWISAWTKQSQKGEKYLSIAVNPKLAKAEEEKPAAVDADLDDKLPF
jgi:hypothetical protein